MEQHNTNLTNLWAAAVLEQLVQLGVEDICIAPGSRSAPLVIAAAKLSLSKTNNGEQGQLRLHTHLDERGLGFFALGLVKARSKPVIVITTSGTAVANLYPAVIEAFQTSQPLIVLSADRPEELLNCGANQAINQKGIFADNVVEFCQIDALDSEAEISENLTSIVRAYQKATMSGPVQINCAFREPLYPTDDVNLLDTDKYLQVFDQARLPTSSKFAAEAIQPSGKTLLIAGDLTPSQAQHVLVLAERFDTPILADINSNLPKHRLVIQSAELILEAQPDLLAEYDSVIQFGGQLVGKRLLNWLSENYFENYLLISPQALALDPSKTATQICLDIDEYCQDAVIEKSDHALLLEKSGQIQEKARTFVRSLSFGELKAAQTICDVLDGSVDLFVGNSLSIRLMDLQSNRDFPVFSNRGASGIDGLLATACGVQQGREKPMVVLLGDTSLLHDLNSLMIARRHTSDFPLILIVLNNDGGSIFNMLPAANLDDVQRDFFQLPHGLEFGNIVKSFDIPHYSPNTEAQFKQQLTELLKQNGVAMIELQVPPTESSQQIKALYAFSRNHGAVSDSKG
ncbi:2-succinyl-5-enolpyruvyl-6-hydroxy-3-cyclohexene-1-carboxylic-acid synthase [Neptuniibacter sp. QD37_11]|uniref:2-succinyl-5-enolpyruvyl-6-hydroxy-3- cyclohexene-1-carboxylic-acid synthase n=1 Tax=Neptuniibacter sp. QD37_11 TaxID=3398209 RepID=UPI0039F466B4